MDEHEGNFLIRATLASHGRGLCIYEEVHGIKTNEKPTTHIQFLTSLAKIVDAEYKPIIVSDAGFETPWFRFVLVQGWDFAGSARLPNFVCVHIFKGINKNQRYRLFLILDHIRCFRLGFN